MMKKIKSKEFSLAGTLTLALLLLSVFIVFSHSSAELTINPADSSSKFDCKIAYAYAGECTMESHTDSNGNEMSCISQYPSTVILNISRVSDDLSQSCRAIIEVYGIQITADRGESENFAYIVGANVGEPLLNITAQSDFIRSIHKIIDKSVYKYGVKGNLNFNWTSGKSLLSPPIGSSSFTSSSNSVLGLWDSGKPNSISVTVGRIGYVTMNDDESIAIYKDTLIKTLATASLNNYYDGFLYNTIVLPSKLPETNLFQPVLVVNPD
jgi:hypothetical protein